MAIRQVELLNPLGRVSVEECPTVKLLDTLRGKTIGIGESYRDWRGFALFSKRVEELLPKKYGVSAVVRFPATAASAGGYADPEEAQVAKSNYDEFAKEVDCAIMGTCF
ncbi:hypothetical protein ACFLV0_01115 [Chloroflexota bacterium]